MTKKMQKWISLMLALALVLTMTGSARAQKGGEESEKKVQDSEEQESGTGDFIWIKEEGVGGAEVSADDGTPAVEEAYSDEEEVRVFILLQGVSALEAGFSPRGLGENEAAEQFSNKTEGQQDTVIRRIQHAVGSDSMEVRYQFSLLDNALSAVVRYGDIDKIKMVSGVEDVYVVPQCQLTDTARPATITAGEMVGSFQTWDSGYTGLGQRIAIVDTGIDEEHPSFDAGAFSYGREQAKSAAGQTAAQEELLGTDEIENVLGQLKISQNGNKPRAEELFHNDKIAYAYNYVDDNLDTSHNYFLEHGVHVVGIAAANEYVPDGNGSYRKQPEGVTGIAKNAQLLIMKVIGEDNTAYTDDYMAAIEDALLLDVDAINLSLGTMNPGESMAFSGEEYVNEILARLLGSDMVVSVSAGNNGAWADKSRYGLNRTEDVNMNTIGNPGSYANVMTVASAVNAGYTGCGFQVEGQTYFYRDAEGKAKLPSVASLDTTGKGTEYAYVYLDSFGEAEDYEDIDVKGKIVFVSKGIISYAEKHENAEKAGAAALFICNDEYGYVKMDISGSKASIPCAMLGWEDSWSLQEADGETIRILSEPVENAQRAEGYRMSDFSSWGVSGDLTLKPEITAPGENIYSTVNGGAYESMSGTSMAAPCIAGMSALISEYIKENDLTEKTGLSVRTLTQSLLMSTSVPLKDEDGEEYSPRKQGSGLANVQAATTTPVYLLAGAKNGNDGKVKAELGDDPDKSGVYEFDLSLYNISGEKQYYALGSSILTEQVTNRKRIAKSAYRLQPKVTFSSKDKTLVYDLNGDEKVDEKDAQELLRHVNESVSLEKVTCRQEKFDFNSDGLVNTVDVYRFLSELDKKQPAVNLLEEVLEVEAQTKVHVRIELSSSDRKYLDTNFLNGMYIDGFIYFNGAVPLSVPMLAFYGNWSDSPMFDPFDYLLYYNGGEERVPAPYSPLERTNYLNCYIAEEEREYRYGSNLYVEHGDAAYIPERNAFSNRSGNKVSSITYTLIRNAALVRITITDDKTGVCYYNSSQEQMQGSFYDSDRARWSNMDYTTSLNWLGTDAAGKRLPEGTSVHITVTAFPEYYKDRPGEAGKGTVFSIPLTIDNTEPELTKIEEASDGNIRLTFEDNRYTAAVKIYDSDKTTLLKSYSVNQEEKGIAEAITIEDPAREFYVKLIDYAGNAASYHVDRSTSSQ